MPAARSADRDGAPGRPLGGGNRRSPAVKTKAQLPTVLALAVWCAAAAALANEAGAAPQCSTAVPTPLRIACGGQKGLQDTAELCAARGCCWASNEMEPVDDGDAAPTLCQFRSGFQHHAPRSVLSNLQPHFQGSGWLIRAGCEVNFATPGTRCRCRLRCR